MAKELPHASIRCPECGTRLKVTLKKGRVPSRPIPCPKCETPIPVTEDDVVDPGNQKKHQRLRSNAELRATRVADLTQTRVGDVDPMAIARGMADPPTRDAPTAENEAADPPTRDVPTAENKAASVEDPPTRDVPTAQNEAVASSDGPPARDVPDEDVPDEKASGAAGFGVIRKAGEPPKKREDPSRDLSMTVNSPGVHVVKGEAKDRVYDPSRRRPGGGVAIGRIRPIKRSLASTFESEVEADDPDLPMLKSASEAIHSEASDDDEVAVAEETSDAGNDRPPDVPAEALSEESEEQADEAPKKPKIPKLKLRKALAKLGDRKKAAPSEQDEEADEEANPLDLQLDFEDSEVEKAIERASSVAEIVEPDEKLEEDEPPAAVSDDENIADVSAGDIQIGDIPMADISVEDLPVDEDTSDADEVEPPAFDESGETELEYEPEEDELEEQSEDELEEQSEELSEEDELEEQPEDRYEPAVELPSSGPPVGVIVAIVMVLAVLIGAYFFLA